VLNAWLAEQKISFSETVFLGNDQNDAECLKACGLGIVVADAHESVIPLADYKLKNRGGNHAIRELTDLIIKNYE
jgi:N-acylneuraminate cytidylyltransferase